MILFFCGVIAGLIYAHIRDRAKPTPFTIDPHVLDEHTRVSTEMRRKLCPGSDRPTLRLVKGGRDVADGFKGLDWNSKTGMFDLTTRRPK